MSALFLTNSDSFPHEIARSLAKGYKSLCIEEDVQVATSISVGSDGDKLVISSAESFDGEPDEYVILCKEFGLFGHNRKLTAEVSVLFCDEGYMLVTLKRGALIMFMDDQPVAPSLNTDDDLSCGTSEIFWVNSEYLLGYSKYWKDKSHFVYDFEFAFRLRGGMNGSATAFTLQSLSEEDRDISLGQFMAWQKQQEAKSAYKETQRMMKTMQVGTTLELEFEEEEDEDDDLVDDEDDDDWE